jgi:hypothetical protein
MSTCTTRVGAGGALITTCTYTYTYAAPGTARDGQVVARATVGGRVRTIGHGGLGHHQLTVAFRHRQRGHDRVARGLELEAGFAFGVVRQLVERRLASADETERAGLLAGSAGAVRSLLLGELLEPSAFDTSFSVLHGL